MPLVVQRWSQYLDEDSHAPGKNSRAYIGYDRTREGLLDCVGCDSTLRNSNGAMMDKMKAASPSKSRKTNELSPSLGLNTMNVRLRLHSMCETEDLTEFGISLLNPNLTWFCR